MITPKDISQAPEDTKGFRYALVRYWREMVEKANYHLLTWRLAGVDTGGKGEVNVVDFTGAGVTSSVADGVLTVNISGGGGGGGGNSVTVTVDFGSSFTHYAETVVTGQAWVAAGSEISVTPLAASGTQMEVAILSFQPVVHSLVAGTGFTLGVYTPIEAKGTYTFSCIGV